MKTKKAIGVALLLTLVASFAYWLGYQHGSSSSRVWGWVGGILGGLMGILGGVIGTYFSIKNTKGPRERAFMIRASIVCWIGVCIFIVGMWFVPTPYQYGLIAIYVVALLLAVRYWNRRQAAIRAEESKPHAA